jgi:hypothetical protein
MRYLHIEVGDVVRFVTSANLAVSKCDRNGKIPPTRLDQAAIEEMLNATEKLWGGLLPYYLWVSKSYRERASTLREAVAEVQSASNPNEFVLVGYEDGGVISISGAELSFQVGARPANWWYPAPVTRAYGLIEGFLRSLGFSSTEQSAAPTGASGVGPPTSGVVPVSTTAAPTSPGTDLSGMK